MQAWLIVAREWETIPLKKAPKYTLFVWLFVPVKCSAVFPYEDNRIQKSTEQRQIAIGKQGRSAWDVDHVLDRKGIFITIWDADFTWLGKNLQLVALRAELLRFSTGLIRGASLE